MTRIFRSLVLISFGLYVIYFFFPYLQGFLYDEEQLEILSYSGIDAIFDLPAWHFYLWLVFWAVVAYGLYNFAKWSRDVLIIGYIVGYFAAPIYGTSILSPISGVLADLTTLLDGIIIGMAYFSPLAARFSPKSTDDLPETQS